MSWSVALGVAGCVCSIKYRSAIGAPLSAQEGRGMGPPKAFITSILTVDDAPAAIVLQILWVHVRMWRVGLKSKSISQLLLQLQGFSDKGLCDCT